MQAHDELAEGRLCATCGDPATMVWSDGGVMAVIHGSYEFRCDICALNEQLEFARECAASIPDLEEQLTAALSGSTVRDVVTS